LEGRIVFPSLFIGVIAIPQAAVFLLSCGCMKLSRRHGKIVLQK